MKYTALSTSLLFVCTLNAAELPITVNLSAEPGAYTVEHWKQDWPGCEFQDGIKEGHVSLKERDGVKWLRVNYAVGGIGPEQGGTGWRWPIGKHEAAELSYTLRFNEDFDFVKGGKLPGLCGGPENVSGGRPADGTNGFSARLMWRKDGRGEAYLYHKNQPDRYGDQVDFPADFRFPEETPIRVRMRVTMNDPGKKNGKIQVWIRLGEDDTEAEQEVVHRTDLEWRSLDTFGVDSLYFESFYGGSDDSWAPKKASWAEFGAISVQ